MTIYIPAWFEGALVPVEKLKVHQQGLRHQAVSIFVMAQDQVLLQRRSLEKYHTPGLWANSCCTHPHWNEDPAHCAQRRLKEELNIDASHFQHRGVIEYQASVGGGLTEHEVVDLFTLTFDAPFIVVPNPEEVCETRWVPVNQLKQEIEAEPDIYTPWFHIYVDEHLNTILGPPSKAKL